MVCVGTVRGCVASLLAVCRLPPPPSFTRMLSLWRAWPDTKGFSLPSRQPCSSCVSSHRRSTFRLPEHLTGRASAETQSCRVHPKWKQGGIMSRVDAPVAMPVSFIPVRGPQRDSDTVLRHKYPHRDPHSRQPQYRPLFPAQHALYCPKSPAMILWP